MDSISHYSEGLRAKRDGYIQYRSTGFIVMCSGRGALSGKKTRNLHLFYIGQMLVHGQKAPVLGRFRLDDLAETLDTINYEIVTSISERVPLVYLSVGGVLIGG